MTWKNCFVFCLSIGLTLAMPAPMRSDCLPAYRYAPQVYSFIHPGLVNPEIPSAPYILSFEEIYRAHGRQEREQVVSNVAEWHQRFCEIPDIQDVGRLIYNSRQQDLQALRNAIANKKLPVPITLQGNSFANYLARNNCTETVDYLLFAKRCEPYVVLEDPWVDRQQYAPAMRDLIDDGLRAFRRTESHYFRLRYAYQIIRLAHYMQEYQRVLDLYDYLMPKTDNDPSIIEYWIMGHRAGALRALGQEVEAAYLFSLVFEHAPSKRESAYQSFRIRTDAQWEDLLQRCTNDEERATLYAIRAGESNSKVLEEMREIFRLDRDNHHLEVLLVKAVTRMEKNLLGEDFNRFRRENRRYHNIPDPAAGQDIISLQTFVRRVRQAEVQARPLLWQFAEGYLALLAGDLYTAQEVFADLKPRIKDPLLEEQLRAIQLVMEVLQIEQVTNRTENRLAEIKYDNALYQRYDDFRDLIFDKITALYRADNKVGKLYLHLYDLEDLIVHPEIPVIDSLLTWVNRSDLNRQERALLRKAESYSLRSDLIDLKGMLQLSQGNQIPAVETLKQLDNVVKDDYVRINPFEERLIDCINCARRDSFRRYNREQIILRMQELQYKALADQNRGARNFYLIGLGLYNMTYFGYAWEGMDKFRSGSSLKKRPQGNDPNVRPHPNYPNGNLEVFDCSYALEYFERAIQLAKDPELAAKAAFMAAKCEQNQYFAYGGEQTFAYFNLLRNEYSNTRFYQRAIAECKYFEAFTTK